jgi:uncharacterized membrane protein YfcA
MYKRIPFEANVVLLVISIIGIILGAFLILESPEEIEPWAGLIGAVVVSFGFFAEVVEETLNRRYNRNGVEVPNSTSTPWTLAL